MENGRVITEYKRAFFVELCCMHAELKRARWGGVSDVGPARHKSFSKFTNLILNWCSLNFCTGHIYILFYICTKSWIYLREQRHAGLRISCVSSPALLQIECRQVDVSPWTLVVLESKDFHEARYTSFAKRQEHSRHLQQFGWVLDGKRPSYCWA